MKLSGTNLFRAKPVTIFMIAFLLLVFAARLHAQPDRSILPLAVAQTDQTTATLLDPANPAWESAQDNLLRISRTPPLFTGDPLDNGFRPDAKVRLLRMANEALVLRAQWTDATEDRGSPTPRYPDAGAKHLYKKHTEDMSHFPDAFCVMAPVKRGPSISYPSLMMGETGQPVDLYFWKGGVGFQHLGAHGRASVVQSSAAPQGRIERSADGWVLTLAISDMPSGTPICFAIWDGAKEHRDGLKYFSLWYQVE